MKKVPFAYAALGTVFAAALVVCLYSGYRIWEAPREAERALRAWDNGRDAAGAGAPEAGHADPPLPDSLFGPAASPGSNPSPQAGASVLTKPAYRSGDLVGKLAVPKLDRVLPVVEGTGDAELKRGAGHYIGSALPGETGNLVLAGHRDTVFRRLGELKPGDAIELETRDGVYRYIVRGARIVKGTDTLLLERGGEEVLTLITCYPFSFIGSAPDRYLLTAVRESL
ncbi:hypothetical protein J31TS4_36080 [Paenibacillus sp. J31TS4]|uniref:class D sortase n=1 Tax=Paenibacillus sp. J31TS4 TaxID=2807195 RepID=UPI001B11D599|nr:class D sortase [Paenibacillus sp. J31TS4]GIP40328.1 hypothetical protein J31TS4_36080 [Paenibacillus sp. J31TS4]